MGNEGERKQRSNHGFRTAQQNGWRPSQEVGKEFKDRRAWEESETSCLGRIELEMTMKQLSGNVRQTGKDLGLEKVLGCRDWHTGDDTDEITQGECKKQGTGGGKSLRDPPERGKAEEELLPTETLKGQLAK